jgi:hypothetical protein
MPNLEWVQLFFRIPLCCRHDATINKGKTSACVKDIFGVLKNICRRIQAHRNIYYPQKQTITLHNHLFLIFAVNPTQAKTFENRYSSQILVLQFVLSVPSG